MKASYTTDGIVEVEPNDLAELVTTTLERLGYQKIRYAKIRAEFTAVDQNRELIDTDFWSHHYRLRLSWKPATSGSMVTVVLEEQEGTGTESDCEDRADQIILALQDDADQAKEVSEWYEPSNVHGEAQWASEEDLLETDLLSPIVESKRLLLAPYSKSLYVQLPEHSTYQHAIVCGRTGVGKSTGFIIPNLIERTDISMIVTEATPGDKEPGELYTLTAGHREKAGHRIYSFNTADLSSTRINPIDVVRLAGDDDKSDEAEKLAALLITNSAGDTSRVDPTWDQSEKLLLTSLILHAASIDKKLGHLGYIRWILLSGVKKVRKILKTSPSEFAQIEFNGWLSNTSENFRFSVISGLLTKLNPWLSDTIVTLTSTTDIDLEELMNEKFTFYLSVPSTRKSMQTIGALVLNFVLDYLLRSQLSKPLSMMLDEFTNFGYIPGMENRLALVRKRKIGMVLGFQNFMQLEKVYGKINAEIILDQPSCQVYFRQKNLNEALRLSKSIGRQTVEERRTQHDGRIHEQIVGRELVTPDELTKLPKDTVIILTADTKPMKVKKFEPGIYNDACSIKPPDRAINEISESTKQRNDIAKEQLKNMEESAPEEQPSKSDPVEPLNFNLSDSERKIVDEIRNKRSLGDEGQEKSSQPEAPDFFSLWDIE